MVNTAEKEKILSIVTSKECCRYEMLRGGPLHWRFESFCSDNKFVSMVELVDAFGSNPKFYRFESYWRYKLVYLRE